METKEKLARMYGADTFLKNEERVGKVPIKEIPVMFGLDGSIICIPERREPNNVVVVGKKGTGKCLHKDTEVITKNGWKKIKDINKGSEVVTINDKYKTEFKKVISKNKKSVEKTYNIKLVSGEEIICSGEHKFPVINRRSLDVYKKKIKDIDKNKELLLKIDKIPIEKNDKRNIHYTLDFDWGFFIGLYLAEGLAIKNRVKISNVNYSLKKFLEKIIKRRDFSFSNKKQEFLIYNSYLYRWIMENFSTGSGKKYIPKWVYNSNENFIEGIINGYMNGDGNINKSGIGYLSKSEKLAKGIRRLLLEVGINSKLKKIFKKYKGEKRLYWEGLILNVKQLREVLILFIKSKDEVIKNRKDSWYYLLPFNNRNLGKNSFFWQKLKGIHLRKNMTKLWEILKNNKNNYFSSQELREKLGIKDISHLSVLKKRGLIDVKKEKKKIKENRILYYLKNKDKLKELEGNVKKIGEYLKRIGEASIREMKKSLGLDWGYSAISQHLKKNGCFGRKEKKITVERLKPVYKLKENAKMDERFINFKSKLKQLVVKLSESDIFGCEIGEIKMKNENAEMYDIQVEDNHNFVLSNTIVSSNSLILNRLASEHFFLKDHNVIIMNDLEEETLVWSEGQDYDKWIVELSRINERPMPIPIVYIFPNSDSLIIENIDKEYVKIAVPFSAIIENSDIFLKLGGSERYFRKLKSKLMKCEVRNDVYNVIEEEYKGKNYRQMRNKILSGLDNVFNEELVSISNPEIPDKMGVKYRGEWIEGNPFIILSKIGVVPSFITSDLFNKNYMPHIFAHHLDEIFKSNAKGLLKDERVELFFDEITHIFDTKNKNPAYESVTKIAALGRKIGIGLKCATQNYSKIPRKIVANTDYVFCFQYSNKKEIKQIIGDFDVDQIYEDQIRGLKELEVIAITNEHFLCYKDGKKYVPSEKVIRGKIIPPMSKHFFRG